MAKVIEVELETDENGELHLTKEQLGEVAPNMRFKVSAEPLEETPRFGPLWATMTPEERVRDFREWALKFRDEDAPALSDWAVSRDSIYD